MKKHIEFNNPTIIGNEIKNIQNNISEQKLTNEIKQQQTQ